MAITDFALSLEKLGLSMNGLKHFNADSQASAVRELDLGGNLMAKVDISPLRQLATLDLGQNALEAFSFGNAPPGLSYMLVVAFPQVSCSKCIKKDIESFRNLEGNLLPFVADFESPLLPNLETLELENNLWDCNSCKLKVFVRYSHMR